MKNVIKKIRCFFEKILGIKFTRSLVVDISDDLYKKNLELQEKVQVLETRIKHVETRENFQCDKNTNESLYKTEFVIANDVWRRNGATVALVNRLEYLSQSSLAWKNCSHEIWLIYISILLELNEIEKATNIWTMYLNKHTNQVEWLHRYLLVSNFAIANGIEAENVLKSSKIYDVLSESRKEKKFENLLLNAKSIAIVGNGPSEKGLGKGVEIDNHDIVIRFNNFQTYGFEDDYGKKTNVWVKCSNDDIKHDKEIYNYSMIVYEADYMHHPMEYGYHNIIFHDIEQGATIDYLDFSLHMELRNLLGGFPSTGLLIIWLVAKLGLLYKTDIYGFSFLQKTTDSYASHYFNDRNKEQAIRKSNHHSFNSESDFVKKLLNGNFEKDFPINDLMNEKIYKYFLSQKKNKEQIDTVKEIHSITHRPFAPNGGSGGGGAVLSCQKILLGNKFKDIECKYTFFESNQFTRLKGICDLHDLWGAALFAIEKTKNETDTIYITHDYGTAFGLYLMGKHYVYINHLQGPRLEEKTNFGEIFTAKSAKIIQECEKLVCDNAHYVCFPSIGAAEYFENSKYQCVDFNKYRRGPVLYNTLYASPQVEIIDSIEKNDSMITILSVGQLTLAKGIDQCVDTIEELLKLSNKKVRWIIVGRGPLKDEILNKCDKLVNNYTHFEYIHIEKCIYQQMLYLQDISDVYMMRQRISIFDLTTLELMKKGKIIVLSDVGGNPEFNIDNNIILHQGNDVTVAEAILESVKHNAGKYNIEIFEKQFSNGCFIKNYHCLIQKIIEEVVYE